MSGMVPGQKESASAKFNPLSRCSDDALYINIATSSSRAAAGNMNSGCSSSTSQFLSGVYDEPNQLAPGAFAP
ncbi:unnamed protein product, partial [Amoebophrya sp. A25]|eukprot:GSA25T00016185001.1